jgi:hypothetical protein
MDLVSHARWAIDTARSGAHELPEGILRIDGMSGTKTRLLYNLLLKLAFEGRKTKYLEVGVCGGSSFVSALHGNWHVDAVAVDNWSEFDGPRDAFLERCERFFENGFLFRLIEGDCFEHAGTISELGKFDVYLYDGGHLEESHAMALTRMYPALADECIFVVDDWNWQCAKDGTYAGLRECGFEVLFECDVSPGCGNDGGGFWNGCGVFVLRKKARA